MGRRGPRPTPLLVKVAQKIQIRGRPGTSYNLQKYAGVPTSKWPASLNGEWTWTGAMTAPRPRKRIVENKAYIVTAPALPRLKGVSSVTRAIYSEMIRPLEPNERIYYYIHGETNPLDVNPLHWEPRSTRHYPYTDADFDIEEALPPVPDDPELVELVEMLNEEWGRKPFTTWQDFHDRFDEIWFDVPTNTRHEALRAANLLHRIK